MVLLRLKVMINEMTFRDGDVPRSTSFGVHISLLFRFAQVSCLVDDFNTGNKVLTAKFSNKDIDIINFASRF